MKELPLHAKTLVKSQNVEQKKLDTKEYILHDSTYISFKKQVKLPCGNRSQSWV